MKYLASIIFILSVIIGCNNSSTVVEDQGNGHDHGAQFILLFQDDMELFAETDQLVEGHSVNIRAHLTFLKDYSPAEAGILYARISFSNRIPDWEPLEFVQPGIYTGSVLPAKLGECEFEFMYEEDELVVNFSKKGLKVYSHDEELPEPPPHEDEVIFTKEQAWKTEFGLMSVELKEFSASVHCSGKVIIAPSSRLELISPASGRVAFNRINLIQGTFVKKGSVLFTIMGTGLSHDNILLELNTARTEYVKSKANMERKEKLLKMEAVSRKDYEAAKATYEQDKTRFDLLNSQVSEAGMSVKSPVSGFISEILISDNSFAETGTVLVKILKEDGIMIKANVPAIHSNKLTSIDGANIRFPNDPMVYPIGEFGGKVLSFGHEIDGQSGMIPFYMSLAKSDIIAGTYVELWLKTKTTTDHLLIPGSSLIEEYGKYFVYVLEEGEAFEKRPISIGESDGVNYQILSGLEPGDVIVSKGGMAIKIANAMGAAPVHSH